MAAIGENADVRKLSLFMRAEALARIGGQVPRHVEEQATVKPPAHPVEIHSGPKAKQNTSLPEAIETYWTPLTL